MRTVLVCLLSIVAVGVYGAGPPLENFCEKLDASHCDVVWSVGTQSSPLSVTVFEVIPTRFSESVISNVLYVSELTPKDKKRPPQSGVFMDKDAIAFGDRAETRHLDIVPSQGWMSFTRLAARPPRGRNAVGVPTQEAALSRALGYLALLGLSETNIVRDAAGRVAPGQMTETEDSYRDKTTGKLFTNVVNKGLTLVRRINGVPVWGHGGLSVSFGEKAQVEAMELVWRSLKAKMEVPVPKAPEIVERIKSGRALVRMSDQMPVERLVIKKAELFYWESEGSVRQTHVYPFLVLRTETGLSGKHSNLDVFLVFTK